MKKRTSLVHNLTHSRRGSNQRKLVMFSGLLTLLTLTSVMLLVMAPSPMVPDAAMSLGGPIGMPPSLDAIFDTQAPIPDGRWKYIYIHHSQTLGGDAATLSQSATGMGDHFLVGNGDGCVDGELQIAQRWTQQQPAAVPSGAAAIDPACISICLVGDFDRTTPTATQMRRVSQLVQTLQGHFHIPATAVILLADPDAAAAGIGGHFPAAAFREQLLLGSALSH